MHDSQPEYEVGYGKPPRATRFGKGVSGNPKGGPKGSKNLSTLFQRVATTRIQVTESGRTRTMTRLEAVLHQFANSALKGNHRAMKEFFQLQRMFELEQARDQPVAIPHERDEMVMKSILKRMQQGQPTLSTTATNDSTGDKS
jgi:hypothetical protein